MKYVRYGTIPYWECCVPKYVPYMVLTHSFCTIPGTKITISFSLSFSLLIILDFSLPRESLSTLLLDGKNHAHLQIHQND
jgi:hypothetical protein